MRAKILFYLCVKKWFNSKAMKKKLIIIPFTLMASLTAAVIAFNHGAFKEAKASSYSITSPTTNIDLNDATASQVRSYYSNLSSLSSSERQGTNLLKNLKPILKKNQQYHSYGGSATTAVWQIYEIVDRDWEKSPASAISGYNSSTNKITGYTYGTSNTSVGSNPYIHALYVNRNVDNQQRAWGNHDQVQWGINQEHIWAKSCGFEDSSHAAGARGDVMHLWAGNGKANNIHSNYYYGYVDKTQSYYDVGSYASSLSGNLRGKSKTKGGSYLVFEPQDSDKGDIARAIFYMVARYNYLSGSDTDGIDSGNPNLELTNELNWAPGSSYTSSTTKKGQMGILQDLLEWNRLDPPDAWEIHRNNLCYNNYTNNRNPFIDFPEWAEFIWGKSVNGVYNSSSTGYATPSSDEINDFSSGGGGGGQETPTLSSIAVSNAKTSYTVGDSFVKPTVTATYSDNSHADVTASAVFSGYNLSTTGNQTVTVSYTEGGVNKTTTYGITVSSVAPASNDATLYSGTITEGDYVIYYNGKAMKNTVSSNRFDYAEVTPTNNSISSPASSIVWHIAPSGNYWTIYNSSVAKYAGGNTSKNQGALLDSITDYAKWTVTGTSTYEFTNKGRAEGSSDTGNKYLRNNGTYGFACYSTGTGGELSLYKLESAAPTPTSITATVSKSYYVGDTITKSDITVEDNLGNEITDFEFNDYQFTYDDAISGGDESIVEFPIDYNEMEATLEVSVYRKAYVAPSTNSLVHTGAEFQSAGVGASYATNQTATVDGITFTVNGYVYNNTKLCLSSSKTSAPGSVINTTPYSTGITNVEITGATPDIQLSVNGSSGWVDLDDATTSTTNYRYLKIFYKTTTQSSYANITQITVTLKGAETAENVANYIMYEDTNGQCQDVGNTKGKFSIASNHFENMTKAERKSFMEDNDDYVIVTARTRFEAWATYLNKTITYSGGDYVINANTSSFSKIVSLNDDNAALAVVITLFSITLIGAGIMLVKKRKLS